MKLSTKGYRKDSKDKKEKSLVIPSGRISMANVDFPVFGVDNTGVSQMMLPGQEFQFPGNSVMEIPLSKKQQGGITPGYLSQSVGYSPFSKQQLQYAWETNKGNKGKPFRTESEVTKGPDGKPFYSYYFYGDQPAQQAPPPAQMASVKKPMVLDPMKQVGYNGMLAPERYQLGGLLSNPLVQMAAPIAANVLLPGSGPLVGMGLKMLNGAQQGQQGQQQGQQTGGGGLGNMLGMVNSVSQIAGMFEKGGPTSGDTRKFLKKRNEDFVDYVAANNRMNMMKEGVSDFHKQMGGQQPLTLNETDSNFYTQGQFGAYGTDANKVPDYVQNNPQKTSVDMSQFVPVASNMGQQIGDALKGDKQPAPAKTPFQLPTSFGDGVMMAMNFYNKSYADQEARRKEKWLEQQQTIEHMAPVDYGSRGDYDVNSGAFRPDQTYKKGGMKCYKKGGSYTVSDSEITDLIKRGIQFEFID